MVKKGYGSTWRNDTSLNSMFLSGKWQWSLEYLAIINQIWNINFESTFYIYDYTLKTESKILMIFTIFSHF